MASSTNADAVAEFERRLQRLEQERQRLERDTRQLRRQVERAEQEQLREPLEDATNADAAEIERRLQRLEQWVQRREHERLAREHLQEGLRVEELKLGDTFWEDMSVGNSRRASGWIQGKVVMPVRGSSEMVCVYINGRVRKRSQAALRRNREMARIAGKPAITAAENEQLDRQESGAWGAMRSLGGSYYR